MRGDDLPAVRKAHTGLHLASHLAGQAIAVEQRRGDGSITAIGRDHGLVGPAAQSDRRARGAKPHDRLIAVEIFADAVTQRAGIIAKQFIEHGDVVGHQRLFVARELRGHLGQHVRKIDLHRYSPLGIGAAATPMCSSTCAMRRAMSSRQGAAMIWTPIGIGASGTGTATTGKPMNEIGWVWMPILARTGSSTPSSTKVACPRFGAMQGVAGAMITSTDLNSSSTFARYQRRNFYVRSTSGAGAITPAIRRSRNAGSKSFGRFRNLSRCNEAPSVVEIT